MADGNLTTLILVSRPEATPLKEAARASAELADIGVKNQVMVVNGILTSYDDIISESLYKKQQAALVGMPEEIRNMETLFHTP